MKKKIINGILMVALLLSATTSFVSCKDNVDDELIPVYAALAQQKDDYAARITSIENQINQLLADETADKEKIEANRIAIQGLQDELDSLRSQLNTINNQIATLSAAVDEINAELDEIGNRLDELEGAVAILQLEILDLQDQIAKMITDIKINNTINNVTGTWNLPGGMSKMLALAAFFGSNETGISQFPNTDEDALVIGDPLTKDEVAAANGQYYHFDQNLITQESGNAGLMFFTVNSNDPTQFDINEWTLSVQNSAGKTAPITFTDVKPSSYQIQWGIFKSGYVDTDPDENGDPTFFQARAHIDRTHLEAAQFDIKKFIDLNELKDDYKAAVQELKNTSGKTAKVKAIVKIVAEQLVKIYSGNMSGNNYDLKNPSWSAQKLILSKEVDGVTIKKGAADYDLAVSSVAPLSYNTFWEIENAAAANFSTAALERAVYRLAKSLKSQIPGIKTGSVEIKKIEYPQAPSSTTANVVVYSTKEYATYEDAEADAEMGQWISSRWVDDYDENGYWIGDHLAYFLATSREVTVEPFIRIDGFTSAIGEDEDIWWTTVIDNNGTLYYMVNQEWYTYNETIAEPIIDAINEGLDTEDLAEMINQVGGYSESLGTAVDNLADRFSSYIEKFGNKIVNALKNHAITRSLAPIVLYNSANGIKKLAYGTSVNKGIMQINVTSLTEELLVPAVAKYVALFKDGKAVQATVYPGNTQMIDLDLTKAGEYTLVISTVDYYGFICNKKYLINVN
jgi:hypothetical protein